MSTSSGMSAAAMRNDTATRIGTSIMGATEYTRVALDYPEPPPPSGTDVARAARWRRGIIFKCGSLPGTQMAQRNRSLPRAVDIRLAH
jgi:hypothetical protein